MSITDSKISNYRNKTIFDWRTFEENDISSFISLMIMKYLKSNFYNLDIHNVIIRDINNMVSVIIQLNDSKIDINVKNMLFNMIDKYINRKEYELKYFAIQSLNENKFEKNKNILIFKNEYIKFTVNYFDPVIISLLPNSFYQPNIKLLNQYYNKFNQWIQIS